MRISVWDIDWYSKKSFLPNYKVQKIVSFHKQKGDFINFITEVEHLSFDYDLMYIVRDNRRSPFPPSKYIDKENVRLVGAEFNYYDNKYTLPAEVEMVRPDYTIYELREENSFANANVIQLLHNKTFLPVIQNPINVAAKGRKKSLLVDDKIWELSDEDLVKYLSLVKDYESIAFLHPISLKRIIDDKFWPQFSSLDFKQNTKFRFKNDLGSDESSCKIIIDKMYELKQKYPHIAINPFPVKAIIFDHWNNKNTGIEDLKRILKIVDYAKQKKVNLIIKTPNDRHITPYWFFFDMLEDWTTYSIDMSYIEMMTSSLTKRSGLQWVQILENYIKWSVPRVDFLLHVITSYPEVLPYTTRKWGDNSIDISSLDFTKVAEFKNYFEREELLNKIQEILNRGDNL